MAIPDWPTDVPHLPDLGTVSAASRMLDPIRTEMEGGNIRLRARPGDNVGQVSYVVPMTKTQIDAFNLWVKSTLGGGTARFRTSVWLDNECVSKVCQFASPPKSQRLGASRLGVALSLRVYDV